MRVLIAVHTYYPDKNGVEAVTKYIAEGIARRHEVLVVSEMKEGYSRQETFQQVEIRRIYVRTKHGAFVGEKKEFYQIIQNFHPDVLISVCTQSWPFDWLWKELDALSCKKVLYTHGYTALMKQYPLISDLFHLRLRAFQYHWHWKRYYDKAYKYMGKYDLMTHLSDNNISMWYSEKHHLRNGIVLENAVENQFFEAPVIDRDELYRADAETGYIYVANYDENKNQRMVLEAFYRAKLPNASLTFIGSRKNPYCEQLIEESIRLKEVYGERKVIIRYGLSRDEMRTLMGNSSIFVCGSRQEQYPIMLCEAAAKGLAIISTDVGNASLLPGALIVYNIKEMKESMEMLYSDTETRRRNGQCLRAFALKNCVIKDKIEELCNSIEQLVIS